MKKSALIGSTALAFLLSGFAAYADVTPEEVWENWKATSMASGTEITVESEARDGDTLVITGVGMAATADPSVTSEGKIDEIRLMDLGDGTVEITMSDSYTMTVTTPAMDGIEPPVAQTITISVNAPGAVTIASGTPEALSYEFSVPTMTLSLVTAADAVDPVNVELSAVNTAGSYLVEGVDPMTVSGGFGADSLSLAVKAKGDAGTTDLDMTAAVGAIETSFDATILDEETMKDMAAAMAAGFGFHFDTAYGATSFTVNVVEAGSPTMIAGGVDSGSVAFGIDADLLDYQTSSKGLNLTISSAEIPFPEVKLGLGEGGFGLTMPTGPSDAPADFSFLAKLVDLSISDEIWGMLDPAGALPHDPATVILDGKGTAQLKTSLFDESVMGSDAPPGDLLSFDLTQLLVKLAGAELTGSGAFTFDNTDLTTFQGMPAPTGMIDLKVSGVNKLIDTLISMGLLTEDDAMGGRMMLSMFANPGDGEDVFTSVLEFKDKGFYANGQRLQ